MKHRLAAEVPRATAYGATSSLPVALAKGCCDLLYRRSLSRAPLGDQSDGAPPSTSPFAVTMTPVAGDHAIWHDAANFWVMP